MSWWDWQETKPAGWGAVGRTLPRLRHPAPALRSPTLVRGDLVVWAQEHLNGAGATLTVDGAFGRRTLAAAKKLQAASALPVSGQIGPATWRALLRRGPVEPDWTASRRAARAAAAGRAGAAAARAPASATLPDVRVEIRSKPHGRQR